jgi:DNA excision repair protein ERCC-2
MLANPVVPADILQEAVPGNIRRAEHFVTFMKKIVEHMKVKTRGGSVCIETPMAFLHILNEQTGLDRKPLKFTYSRLNSLLRTLEVSRCCFTV